jgi:chromosome segregation protein
MHTEERRKIIEEVSGISIYEMRKEKSLRELEKTEEKLKEVSTILRERTIYLNNLEKERQQALKYKKLESDVQKLKASIIFHDLSKKKKEGEQVLKDIEQKNKEVEKIKKRIIEIKTDIENFENKIGAINTNIQKSAGIEQEKLNQEIANMRANLMGLSVKKEHYEKKISEIRKQKMEVQETIRNNDMSIKEISEKSGSVSQKTKELTRKKQELEKLDERRKKFYTIKTELKVLKERIQDKNSLLQSYKNEESFLLKQIENAYQSLFDKKIDQTQVEKLKILVAEKINNQKEITQKEIELQKIAHTNNFEINRQNKLAENISKMDICPICKNKITKEHIININKEIEPKINFLKNESENALKELDEIAHKKRDIEKEIEKINLEIIKRERDLLKVADINAKKEQIKSIEEKIEKIRREIQEIEKRNKFLEGNFDDDNGIERKYELLRMEIQEISVRNEENIDAEVSFKQRETERARVSLKQLERDSEEVTEELEKIQKLIKENEEDVEKKKSQEEELNKKFQKLIEERDKFQTKVRENESEMLKEQNRHYSTDQDLNNFKIIKAKIDAETENLEMEMLNFPNSEIIKTNKEALIERLNSTKEILANIGSINLRALEMYDSIKAEYDAVNQKVEIIIKEKEGILKIIHEIDIKKKKTFLNTLESLNEIFSRNFTQLSTKGEVYLEIENKKEPFDGGVSITVKTGHGKYFDVTSLSGGEQTLVALSLIFAIQELKPYSFYILDEIDAALDKRNSERLAGLLRKYMEKGQYIVITHNDEVISRATTLYGVSMHEGISKVISLKI